MIGVDFGGTRLKAGIVEGGVVAREAAVDTPHDGSASVLDAIASLVRGLGPTYSVGVAIPGEIDRQGRCYRLPNVPGFEGVAVAAELERRLDCPVVVENDATTAALGELLYGHGRRHGSFLMVTLGTGIGGGVVIDRRLRRGANGFGGEIGHIPIDRAEDAPLCNCGLRGCVEAFAGTRALLARYNAPSVRAIAEAAHGGDTRAIATFEQMGGALGLMVTCVMNVLDLDAIVFSGGISASFDLIEPTVRRVIRKRAHGPPLGEVPLLVSELAGHAGVLGAAHLHEHLKDR